MTQRPLRVLQVVGALGMGGAETWLMALLHHWSRTGAVRPDFLITGSEAAIFDDKAKALGARLHYLKYRRRSLRSFLRGFRNLLREGNYDAIHDHADYASGWHFLLGAGVLPPIRVAHVHNPWLHVEANYAVTPSRRLAAAGGKRLVGTLATHVCGTSAEILVRYGFTPNQKGTPAVSVVHCGIDVAKFGGPREEDRQSVLREFGWDAQAKIVLFAGRLDRALTFYDPQNHKNSWFALNVAKLAHKRNPGVRLLMAGAGDEQRRMLEAHVDEWGLRNAFRLISVRHDMPRLMRAADLLLFPSRQEGLGMVAVEAQAAGLPVLASTAVPRECVVIPELYDAMPLTESVERWAEAVLERMTTEKPAPDECRRALEASPFSIHESARRLESIYSSGLV